MREDSSLVVNEQQGSGDCVQNETQERAEEEAERESGTGTETRIQFDRIDDKVRDKGCGEDKLNILRMVLGRNDKG